MAAETTKVKRCNCANEGQDKLYGNKNRVFNLTSKSSQKKGESGEYRCSCCGIKNKYIN